MTTFISKKSVLIKALNIFSIDGYIIFLSSISLFNFFIISLK